LVAEILSMSANPEKDFGPIADDYAFFETHATEAEQDVQAYALHLAGLGAADEIRMLDFGCGSGTFTARFLDRMGWPPGRLRLTLVEPVEAARQQAAARLLPYTRTPMAGWATLTAGQIDRFDVVLANHVFYYVPNLKHHLARLIDTLSSTGRFLTAIAGQTNALIEFWRVGFGLLGCAIPYNLSEDVEAALQELGVDYRKEQVAYELIFPDTAANRMKILRFLLADHLGRLPHRPLLNLFDRHAHAGRIEIRTASEHFTIRPRAGAP
jgi:trans-aconitate 2-methyltransferase